MKDKAGERLKHSLKLNFKNTNQHIKELIGGDDTVDIMQFKSSSSAVEITAKGLASKDNLDLYQVDRKLGETLKKIGQREFTALRPSQQNKFLSSLDLSEVDQGKKSTYTTELEKGVYFLVVSSSSPKSRKYTLKFSASPLNETPSPGGTDEDNPANGTTGGADNGSTDGTNGGTTGGATEDTNDGGTTGGTTDDTNTDGTSNDGSTDGSNDGTDGTTGDTTDGTNDGGTTDGTDGGTTGGSTGGTDGNGSSNSDSSWTRQLGSSVNDYGYGVAVDADGNVYVAGTTAGSLEGVNGGSQDNFVTKYDATGQLIWTRQFDFDNTAPSNSDTIFDIVVDSAGNYYIAGATAVLPATFSLANAGQYDADGVVAKYNRNGDQLWKVVIEIGNDTKSYNVGLSTVNVHKFDAASSLAIAPDGSIYVGGFVEAIPNIDTLFGFLNGNPSQGFIAKLDAVTGTRQWLTTLGGSAADAVADLAIDNDGKIYVTGIQDATLATVNVSNSDFSSAVNEPFVGGDAFVFHYQENGIADGADLLWSQTLTSTNNQQVYARAIALDSDNNVYITGDTIGGLPGQTSAGDSDGFIAKYATNGGQQWVKQFGTPAREQSQAIAIDSMGKIYITGETAGSLYGSNLGSDDIWIATYDTSGTLTGNTQFGTPNAEELYRATVDSNDNVYFVGQTLGDWATIGANQGLFDVMVLKNPVV